MKTSYKIVAIHKPTKEQIELGVEKTFEKAIYTCDNNIEFDKNDVYEDWAFQIVTDNNIVVAYGTTLKDLINKCLYNI